MLIYHPAFDVNHARLRLIQLLDSAKPPELSFDLLRILDFYFLFPHLLADIKLTRGMTGLKRELAGRANKYNRVPSPRTLIRQMEGVQETAVRALEAVRLVELPLAGVSVVKRSSAPLPEGLVKVINEQPAEEKALAQALATEVAKIPLNGPDGLKARTGLLEYRYDPA
jgi:hypothetical protein